MKKTTQAEHHQHMRTKRRKKESTLHRVMDKLVYVAGPMIPVAIAPTAYDVVQGQIDGINLITWGILSVTSTIMGTYAVLHREVPLILTYLPLTVLNLTVVVGTLLQR